MILIKQEGHNMTDRINHALSCDLKELTVIEQHWPNLGEVGYHLGKPNDYTVCIWRIKLKPGIMFDNTSNPES